MVKIAFQIFALFLPLMQSATTPIRSGVVARELTDEDIAALELVLEPSASTPWLLIGDRVLDNYTQYIEALLPPTVETAVLRRGTIMQVKRPRAQTAWVVWRTEPYAQVAIPGRSFDDIHDDNINRPFRVVGQFDDMDVIRIVQLVRSNTLARTGQAIPQRPILSINRQADGSVDVMLSEEVTHGHVVKLRQSGQDWMILAVGTWDA